MDDPTLLFWRARWGSGEALSPATLRGLDNVVRPPRRMLARRAAIASGSVLDALEIALLRVNVPRHQPLAPTAELTGRGYRRVPVGPLIRTTEAIPSRFRNTLQIVWPQAPVDWGGATFLALLQSGVDQVLATAPIATPPFIVMAGDQPRIPVRGLTIGGVGPNTRRPFGTGRFSESLFSGYPAEGGVFWFEIDQLGYAWAREPNVCEPWPADPVLVGGCR